MALAERVGGEVVSADSQQVYTGMDIGTGKVMAADRRGIPHHLIDIVAPDDDMTAARFAALADAVLADLAGRRVPAIVCGGTGLYIRALLLGLFEGPPADPDFRAGLAEVAARDGTHAVWERLAAVDAPAAARIADTDLIRITRALEVLEKTGITLTEHHRRHDHRRAPLRYPCRVVAIAPPAEELYPRIDARVEDMLARGLLDEVRSLRARGFCPPLRSQAAIGYAALHRHLDGAISLGEAVRLIKRNSRRYARRQVSWYRRDNSVLWHREATAVDLASLERYLRETDHDPGDHAH